MPIFLDCSCGKKLKVRDELAGKRVKCPECGELAAVPASAAGIPTAAIAAPLTENPIPVARLATPLCPSCGKDLPTSHVLCVACGFDRRTGSKIETKISSMPAPEADGDYACRRCGSPLQEEGQKCPVCRAAVKALVKKMDDGKKLANPKKRQTPSSETDEEVPIESLDQAKDSSPPKKKARGNQAGLGRLLFESKPPKGHFLTNLVAGSIALLLGPIALIGGGLVVFSAITESGPAIQHGFGILICSVGLTLLGKGGAVFARAWRNSSRSIGVYHGGLVAITKGMQEEFLWQEIETFEVSALESENKGALETLQTIHIVRKDGRTLDIDGSFPRIQTIITTLDENCSPSEKE